MQVKRPLIYYGILFITILSWIVLYKPGFATPSQMTGVILFQTSLVFLLLALDTLTDKKKLQWFFRGLLFIFTLYVIIDTLVLRITSITFLESMVIFSLGGDFVLTMMEAGFPPVLIGFLPVIILLVIAMGAFIASKTPQINITGSRKVIYGITVLLLISVAADQFYWRNDPTFLDRRKFPGYVMFFDTNDSTLAVPLPLNRNKKVQGLVAPKKMKDILFIVLESFRNDAVTKETAPELYQFSKNSIRFSRAYGDGIYTSLSWNALMMNRPAWAIDSDVRTFNAKRNGSYYFQVLKKAGYLTAIISSANMNWNYFYDRINGADKVVDYLYSPYGEKKGEPRNSLDTKTIDHVINYYKSYKSRKPLFMMIQLDSTHWTYYPDKKLSTDKPYVERINMLSLTNKEAITPVYNRYKNSVRTVDNRIHRLLEYLRKSDRYKDMAICIVADHGEGFNPGRVGHSVLHDEIRRIFFAMKIPGKKRRVISTIVQHRDAFPFLLSQLSIKGVWMKNLLGSPKMKKNRPRLIFHGSTRMADLIYDTYSVRYVVRVRNNMVYATPLYKHNGYNIKDITMIDKRQADRYNTDFINIALDKTNEN